MTNSQHGEFEIYFMYCFTQNANQYSENLNLKDETLKKVAYGRSTQLCKFKNEIQVKTNSNYQQFGFSGPVLLMHSI